MTIRQQRIIKAAEQYREAAVCEGGSAQAMEAAENACCTPELMVLRFGPFAVKNAPDIVEADRRHDEAERAWQTASGRTALAIKTLLDAARSDECGKCSSPVPSDWIPTEGCHCPWCQDARLRGGEA